MDLKKMAVITSHPIQYNAPLFMLLHQRKNIQLKVFYTWGQSQEGKVYDPGFGSIRQWDIPLTAGYECEFLYNVAVTPGSHHFYGIDNPDIIKRIEDYAPDAILVYGWSFKSHLKVLRYFKNKVPVLFRGDSTLIDEMPGFTIKKILRRIFLFWVYRHIDKALVVGTANKVYYLRHGIKMAQIETALHAIDNSRFGQPEESYEAAAANWRKKLSLSTDAMVFLFAGKLEQKKNPALLISAFKKINNTEARLILAGTGVQEKFLKEQAVGDKRIIFADFVNQQQMPVLYRLADVFVLPSQGPGETWGLAINEAMASGRAVIASDKCGGASDLITPSTGWVFTSGSQKELTEILELCVLHPHQVKRLGKEAQKHIASFNYVSIARKIEELVIQ